MEASPPSPPPAQQVLQGTGRGSVWHEARQTLALAVPIMSGMLGQMLMGISDTVMVGRVGTVPLAACAFAHNLYNLPLVGGVGLLSAVGVLTAQAYGSKQPMHAGETLKHGLWIGATIGLLAGVGLTLTRQSYGWLGQPPEVLLEAQTYLVVVAWSILPALLVQSLKNFSEALNHPWPPFFILMGGVLLNIGLNWVMIFGHLGCPALGLAGAGWATLLARIAVLLGMAAYILCTPSLAPYRPPHIRRPAWSGIQKLAAIGGPAAAQNLLEIGAFVAAAFLMGWISTAAIAAHQIAITCAATSFILAFGIGMATSIRVGHAWGAQNLALARRVGLGSLGLTAVMMGGFGLLFLVAAVPISRLFTLEPEVVRLAAGMLQVAAFFQVLDGLQVVALCALRGMSDVRVPALTAILAYWLVALPLGYLLCFNLRLGPNGLWMGLAAGLGTAALLLSWRFAHLSQLRVR